MGSAWRVDQSRLETQLLGGSQEGHVENSGAGPAGPQPGVRPHRQAARWGWGVLHPRRAEPRVGSMTQGQRDSKQKGELGRQGRL